MLNMILPDLPTFPHCVIRHIPGFPGYAVTDTGEVWGCRTAGWNETTNGQEYLPYWRQRRLALSRRGYMVIYLRYRKKITVRYVHHLVLEAFIGQRPERHEACHADGDRCNNALENLRWDTRKGNMQDTKRLGCTPSGTKSHMAKLEDQQIYEITALYAHGHTQKSISIMFHISRAMVSLIVRGKNWQHLSRESAKKDRHIKLTWEDVHEIRRLLDSGLSQSTIARQFNVDTTSISLIHRGKTWKEPTILP